jgi:hypothetical protein
MASNTIILNVYYTFEAVIFIHCTKLMKYMSVGFEVLTVGNIFWDYTVLYPRR